MPLTLRPRLSSLLGASALLACTVDADVHDDDFDYEFQEQADSSDEPTLQPRSGEKQLPRLQLRLRTDAPVGVDAVFVTFDPVRVKGCAEPVGDEECLEPIWTSVGEEPVTVDLLRLQGGVTAELGSAELEPGDYGLFRFDLSRATVVVRGKEYPLAMPSPEVWIDGGFTLEADVQTDITFAFDLRHSLQRARDSWRLDPVIEIAAESTRTIPADDGVPERD